MPKHGLLYCCLFHLFLLFAQHARTQDSTLKNVPANYLPQLSARLSNLEAKLDKKTNKTLLRLQKEENEIKHKLVSLDSSKAKQIFDGSEAKYSELKQKLEDPSKLSGYIPYFDTLKTSLKFLQDGKEKLSHIEDVESKLDHAEGKIKGLENSLAKSEQLKAFIKERRTYLKQNLAGLPFSKQLKKLNKKAYYYSAQVAEYKAALKDPKKLERKAIGMLTKSKPFQDFMRNNSQLAFLFRSPGSSNGPGAQLSLQGLQTRAQMTALIQNRIGTGANAQAVFRENVRDAQASLSQLKDKVVQYGDVSFGNSADFEQPDFKPNSQKTKSFASRIEYGGNIQSQKARNFFPVTSDIAVSLGYKLNDKSVLGIAGSYKLGLGKGWNNMTLSHQGLGIRSFMDYKLKGSIYLSGGYEQNYRTLIQSIDQLKNYNAWQSSGLIGLSKKYSISKKFKGNVQLLWDFLSYQQVPRTQAILFRVGYSLK